MPSAGTGYEVTNCDRNKRRAGQLWLPGAGTGYNITSYGRDKRRIMSLVDAWSSDWLWSNQQWQWQKAGRTVLSTGCLECDLFSAALPSMSTQREKTAPTEQVKYFIPFSGKCGCHTWITNKQYLPIQKSQCKSPQYIQARLKPQVLFLEYNYITYGNAL